MSKSNVVAFLVTLVVFGFFVPWWKGLDFLDPVLFVISSSIPLVFVTPIVAADGAKNAIRSRVVTAVAFGFTLSLLIVLNGAAMVNVLHWFGRLILPPAAVLAGILLLDLAAAVFLAVASAFLLQRMPPAKVRRVVRFAFFGVLLAWIIGSRFAPQSIREFFDRNFTTDALTANAFIAAAILGILIGILWRPAFRPAPGSPAA